MHWVVVALLALDLTAVRSEPNLEKRSDLALKHADAAVSAARDAYKAGEFEGLKSRLEEVRESVDLSFKSLADSGKNPRRANSYKRAEQATRQLVRRLDGLRDTMSLVDREALDPVRARVAEVHDQLLTAIMRKK
jgi:hypothetical protein